MKPVVLLTHPLPEIVMKRDLLPCARVILVKKSQGRKALLHAIARADALIPLVSDTIDRDLLARGTRLKAIGNFGVGINNIDLRACAEFGIRVANTPDVLTRATAELTLALLLAAARRIPEGERMCRAGKFRGWAPDMLLGLELKGRSAVIVGAGRIGNETARLFRGIGLLTSFITRKDSPQAILRKLRTAQILSIHVPLSKETHHWLDRARIAVLPRDCIVLNTSRGPAIDEKALTAALAKQRIYAAGLDVFENEPHIPSRLRKLDNVVLLPHLGSATAAAREGMAHLAVTGALAILDGQYPPNEVRFSR